MERPIGPMASNLYCFSMMHTRRLVMGMAIALLLVLSQTLVSAGEVAVHYPEGTAHGLFVLRSLNNKEIGRGDLTETVDGSRVASNLKLTFNDGSVYEETTHFTEDGRFHVLDYHVAQKGPSFKATLDMTVDSATGNVVVHTTDDSGQMKTWTRHMRLPRDLANGIVPFLVRNVSPKTDHVRVSMIAATPKPRLVQVTISPADLQTFPLDGSKLQAMRYSINVDVGGLIGPFAKITGREPAPAFIWMLSGRVPSFLMAQEAFEGGPVCRIELLSPNMSHPQDGQTPGD
jgi:hypothetical protein